MESAGMMKMATGDGSPSGRVPEQGPDWFLVATEACGGGTSDLGYFLEVSVFTGISGVGLTSGGVPESSTRQGGAPSTLLDGSGLFWPNSLLQGILLVHKKSSKIGTSIGLHLVFLFCDTQKQGKTETGTGL